VRDHDACSTSRDRLNDEGVEVIKTHTRVGADILAPAFLYGVRNDRLATPTSTGDGAWVSRGPDRRADPARRAKASGPSTLPRDDLGSSLPGEDECRRGSRRLPGRLEDNAGTQFGTPEVVEALMVVLDRIFDQGSRAGDMTKP